MCFSPCRGTPGSTGSPGGSVQRIDALPVQAEAVRALVDGLLSEKRVLVRELQRAEKARAQQTQEVSILRDLLRERNLLVLELQEKKVSLERQITRAEQMEESKFIGLKLEQEGFPLDRRELYEFCKSQRDVFTKRQADLKRKLDDEQAKSQLLMLALGKDIEFQKEACEAQVAELSSSLEKEREGLQQEIDSLQAQMKQYIADRDHAHQRAMVNAFNCSMKEEELLRANVELEEKRRLLQEKKELELKPKGVQFWLQQAEFCTTLSNALLTSRVSFLESELARHASGNRRLAEVNETLEWKLFDVNQHNAHLNAEMQNLQLQHVSMEELQGALEEACRESAELRQVVEELTCRVEHHDISEGELSRFQAQLQGTQEQLCTAKQVHKQQVAELHSQLEAKTSELEEERRKRAETQAELKSRTGTEYKEACTEAQLQVDVLKQRLKDEKQSKETAVAALELRIRHLVDSLQRRNEVVQSHCEQAEETFEVLEATQKVAEHGLQGSDREILEQKLGIALPSPLHDEVCGSGPLKGI